MPETIAERAERTGIVAGPNHPLVRETVTQRMNREKGGKPKSGTVIMQEKQSDDAKRDSIRAALRAKFPPKKSKGDSDMPTGSSPWPDEIDDDTVIFSRGGMKYAAPYSLGKNGKASIGEDFPVGRQYVAL